MVVENQARSRVSRREDKRRFTSVFVPLLFEFGSFFNRTASCLCWPHLVSVVTDSPAWIRGLFIHFDIVFALFGDNCPQLFLYNVNVFKKWEKTKQGHLSGTCSCAYIHTGVNKCCIFLLNIFINTVWHTLTLTDCVYRFIYLGK